MMVVTQSLYPNFDLVEEIDENAAETISGGYEVFTVKNETQYNISYYVDGTKTKFPNPGAVSIWTAYKGGIIEFDTDSRDNYVELKKYDLSDGRVYAFRDNKSTVGNPYDIELYRIG